MKEEEDTFGFKPQKEVVYNKLLPYSGKLQEEILEHLKCIKENLAKAVILRDIRPGCIHWVAKLSRFVKLYGMCFSKEDHILFVKLMYEICIIPDQEFWVTSYFAQMLTILLKKGELLSPKDLELPWKPLYELYDRLFYSPYDALGMIMLPSNAEGVIKAMIRACRAYFPLTATAEMLEEWRPFMCPFDVTMRMAVRYFELFLPASIPPTQTEHGWKIWFDELMGIWDACHNHPPWEGNLFWLFTRLAWLNIGYIDWEPYKPMIFTRILTSFQLPVTYKQKQISKGQSLDSSATSMFIVATLGGDSSTQEHLNRLFKTLESYFHPSNAGRWTRPLHDFLNKLASLFIKRLHRERYKKPSWETPVAPEAKLTEEDITAFVKCVQPVAQLAMFSKLGAHDAGSIFHYLSLLRPEIVIPPLLEQLYLSLETMTEPHRLTASLQCVSSVARALVKGGKYYPEGPTHVIPLLMLSLPGIDPNDIKKCMVTFHFISTLITLVPLVDCSAAVDQVEDLTDVEQQVCLQTAGFEDFVLQFIDRSFALIENSALEQTTQLDRETEKMNGQENMVEMGLSSTFSAILIQSHPKIYQAALQRLQTYTKGRILETCVAGRFIANMCLAAAKVNPPEALKALVPGVCRLILTLTESDDVLEEEHLDEELIFNLLLLSEIIRCTGQDIVEYVPRLTEVLSRILYLKCREGYLMAGRTLCHLLKCLTSTLPREYRSTPNTWDTDFKEFLPIRHWGVPGDIYTLGIEWKEPRQEAEEAIKSLIQKFLVPELKLLRGVTQGEVSVSRDKLHQSLSITSDILLGAGAALPLWEQEPITLIDMAVEKDTCQFVVTSRPLEVHLEEEGFPSNVRLAIAEVLQEFVKKQLGTGSDDTKSFMHAINIYQGLLFFRGVVKEEFDGRWKSFQSVKRAMANGLIRSKQHIRAVLIERTALQHMSRVLEGSTLHFMKTHEDILHSLFELATSQYSEVRSKAQVVMNMVFRSFPYSYKMILPGLVDLLKHDPSVTHEQFKGALYILLGSKSKSLVVRRDWESLNMIWPALLAAQHSEKPSIVKLLESLADTASRYMELFSIFYSVPDSSVKSARELLQSTSIPHVNATIAVDAEEAACQSLVEKGNQNNRHYEQLVDKLVTMLNSGTLHWHHYDMTLYMLFMLIRPDVPFPAVAVKAFVNNLIHESISVRKTAIHGMACILKKQKRKHKMVEVDPYCANEKPCTQRDLRPGDAREDNRWLQYDASKPITNQKEWDAPRFVHKTHYGWYTWPKPMKVYAPSAEQPTLDRKEGELDPGEREVYIFFKSQDNVDKLIKFLSAEERKGRDKFDSRRFWMFKGLFRNFGDMFLTQFQHHLERLVADSQESSQRCATEIIAGLIRGSKHWTYEKHANLWKVLRPILEMGMSKVTVETVGDWGTCMATASESRDPNRIAPLLELLMEDPLREKEGAFLEASRLYMLQGGIAQQEWRIAELCHRLLEYLKPHLAHPYQSVRDRISSVLTNIFLQDIHLPNGSGTLYPQREDFLECVLPQLALLVEDIGTNGSSLAPSPTCISSFSGVVQSDDVKNILTDPSDIKRIQSESSVKSVSSESAGVENVPSEPSGVRNRPVDCREGNELKVIEDMDIRLDMSPVESVHNMKISVDVMKSSNCTNNHTMNGLVTVEHNERKLAIQLMNTMCTWVMGQITRSYYAAPPETYRLLPHLCQLESVDSDPELSNNCTMTLTFLSSALIHPRNIPLAVSTIIQISNMGWWRARAAVLSVLQVMVFNNMFHLLQDPEAPTLIRNQVVELLRDPRLEVRQIASEVLGGLIHCKFINADQTLLGEFKAKLDDGKKAKKRKRQIVLTPEKLMERHGAILGLCAYVSAFPYEVPDNLPEILLVLSDHLNDPQPIPGTIKKTLSNFRRTHHDNWRDHKQKFTEDQLVVLTDILVSPSYYA
ncbi:proteasome activator complex subunit 4-like isoform X2 [Oratosquilla oratoria]|uniref:proteasome activator complex subunit 4-like isoform X2 n=1 Tax=Oratosquilla oratoria TaxID=337810 RepID=UPI003F757E6C